MPLSLADIERWDTQSVRDVGQALVDTAMSMDDVEDGFKRLPHVGHWSGIAADAANQNLDHLGKYLTENAAARREAGKAMSLAADQIDGLKQLLSHVKDEAARGRFIIDLTTGTVTPQDSQYDPSIGEYLKTTISQIQDAAENCDEELAQAVNLADGSEPASSTMYDGKPVYTAQRRNQIEAFKQATGHSPMTPSDWRTAAMLDAHNYDPKYKGTSSEVVAARITPEPGKGVVQINAFIPGKRVWNFGHDRGDDRGFDANSLPEHSRGNLLIDYENGLVIARDNPSVSVESGNVAVHKPEVSVAQAKDGTLNIKYDMADGFLPGGATAGSLSLHNVAGELVIKPTDNGFQLGGHITDFPAMEIYHENEPLYRYMPTMGYDEAGPLIQLMTQHPVGDPGLLDQFQTHKLIPHGDVLVRVPAVALGPVTNMPVAPVS